MCVVLWKVIQNLLSKPVPDVQQRTSAGLAVTGVEGGKMLVCYIFSVKDHMECGFLRTAGDDSLKVFLEKQQCVYVAPLYPAQARCLTKAISFLPDLVRGLATAQQAHVPAPDFDEVPAPRQPPAADFNVRADEAHTPLLSPYKSTMSAAHSRRPTSP